MAAETTYTVERHADVAATPEQVRPHLEALRRWQAWSPFEGLDDELQREYSGPESGPGSAYAWSGDKKAGRGRMRVLESTPQAVSVEVAFEKPFRSTSTSTFTMAPQAPAADGTPRTRVTWAMTGPRPLLLRLLGPVVSMDKVVGKDFERGLAQLAAVAEGRSA